MCRASQLKERAVAGTAALQPECRDGYTIRNFVASDHSAVVQLFREGMLSYPQSHQDLQHLHAMWSAYVEGAINDDLARIPEVYDTLEPPDAPGIGCFLVAVDSSGTIQGMVALQALREKSATAELRRMSVARSAQRSGIGRKLVAQLEEWARSHGFETVELSTLVQMRQACHFYRSIGYHEVRRMPLPRGPKPDLETGGDGDVEPPDAAPSQSHPPPEVVYFSKRVAPPA